VTREEKAKAKMGGCPSTVSWLPIYPNGYIPRTAPLAQGASQHSKERKHPPGKPWALG